MNKVEKILMFIIVMILSILTTLIILIGNTKADGNEINKIVNQGALTATLNLSDLEQRDDLFCLQHDKHLSRNTSYVYDVSRKVSIIGNKLDNGLTDDVVNGTLAYIVHQGTKTGGYGTVGNYGDGQIALYHYYEDWYNRTKQLGEANVNNLIEPVAGNKTVGLTQKATEIINEAKNYANDLGNGIEAISENNQQTRHKVKASHYTDNNTDITYLMVGPIYWDFSGNVSDIKIYFDDNIEFTDFSVVEIQGRNKVEINKEGIISGRPFYLRMKASKVSNYKTIGKIKATNSRNIENVIIANMWFLKHSNTQNLLLVQTGTTTIPESNTATFNYDNIPILKDIEIYKIRTQKDENGNDVKLGNVEFIIQNKETGRYLAQENGVRKWKYKDLTAKEAKNKSDILKFKTKNSGDDKGKVVIKDLPIAEYIVYEISNPNEGYSVPEDGRKIEVGVNVTKKTIKNRYKFGEFSLEKVDKDYPEIKLPNVEFTLKAKTGEAKEKYVGVDSNGNATYSDSEVHIKTDDKGKISIKKLWEGKYQLTEVNNPNYGYVIEEESVEIKVEPLQTTSKTAKNEQKYIKLSGFIWQDIHSAKDSIRNDYYKTDGIPNEYKDENDEAFNGITVRLKYKDEKGNVTTVKETTSEEKGLYDEIDGGEYIFEDVLMKDSNGNNILDRYYIEFEYDGLIYQSVVVHKDNDRGSKAADKDERDILDKNFASVDSTGENRVDVNNSTYSITYNETVMDENGQNVATIKDSSACTLHAKTDDSDAKYNIKDDFVPGQPEIRYINLGLYKKPQADLSLTQDLANVHVGVNGYWHIYNYGRRTLESNEYNKDDESTWNVGVKFKNSFTGTYKRAIYEADKKYERPDARDRELQVYLTYKIALTNESSYLTRVNNIVDYYDNRYTVIGVGTELNEENKPTGDVSYQTSQTYNDKYNKFIIDVNSTVESGRSNYIYVQFKLDRSVVLDIMNNKEPLDNTAEINSYTVYKDNNGNTVAAVDRDSVPGNVRIEDPETYEDDTNTAPPILLEIAPNARRIEGTVFEDNEGLKAELQTGRTRLGDGKFNETNEPRISDVKVTLHELNNSIPDKEYTTGEDGNFNFEGYIPGQYTITYTWGDKKYTVQNYKGTIYDLNRNQNDMYWYKDNADIRKTDAIDNYARRQDIDNEIQLITDNKIFEELEKAYDGEESRVTFTKMDSMTPTMEFSVEYETTVTDGVGDQVEFTIKNVDFGIVERAKQKLDMRKRVKTFKIILANEQVLIDATVSEDGKLEGVHKYLTYMGPSKINGISDSGFIKAELDNELLQGARLEVTYEIKFVNNSEIEYLTENYYKYGTEGGIKATITPAGVVDYLDKNLGFEQDRNSDWEQITQERLEELNAVKVGDTEFINSRMILYTDKTSERELQPKTAKINNKGETISFEGVEEATNKVELNVSKILTSSGDMTFKNDAETVEIKQKIPIPPPPPTPPEDPPIQIPPEDPPTPIPPVPPFPFDTGEKVEITPSTGDDRNYVVPIAVGITSLVILGCGIFIIKKKVIDNK